MIKVLLIVVQGKPEGKTLPITGPVFRIGRDQTCHLRPSSDQVSRQHAEITVSDTTVTIRDLGSRNGTMLNGRMLTGTSTLRAGDLVKIGHLTFAVVIQGVPADAETVAPPRPVPAGVGSLDDVPQDQIESWLVADNDHDLPDRPSGVYDGETITINAYKDAKAVDPARTSVPADPPRAATPAKTPDPVARPVAASPVPSPAPAPVGEEDTEYERLPEGVGDAEPESEDGDEEGADEAPEELIDESNPFYAAKKKAKQEVQDSKPAFKDSSDAANAILRKMLERRRAGR